MRLFVPLLIVLALAAVVAAGPVQATPRAEVGKCLRVARPLTSSIKDGLRAKARGKLGKLVAVKGATSGGFVPRGLQKGVYFVSGKVRGYGIATWAVSADAFKTGGGLIYSIGPTARKVSTLGVDVAKSVLSGWGLTAHSSAYVASRACL